jgi:hypothetical protein
MMSGVARGIGEIWYPCESCVVESQCSEMALLPGFEGIQGKVVHVFVSNARDTANTRGVTHD